MASKALKVVGIGCGALVLIAVIGVVAAGYWVKGKVEGMGEWAEKMEAQNKELAALDQQYPFSPPAEGEAPTLDEAKLQKYLAVRGGLEPVYAKFEAQTKEMEKKKQSGEVSASDAFAAIGAAGNMMFELRAAFIEQLKAQQMSPKEFHATTTAVYSSLHQEGTETAQLLEQYKEQIEKHASVGLDGMLVADSSAQ